MDDKARKALEEVDAARKFGVNTCGSSRHAQMIGECLAKRLPYPMLEEEPEYCAESILSTVTSLYKARDRIAELERTVERTDEQIVALGVLAMRGVAPEEPPKKIVDAICDWFDRNIMGCSTKDAADLYSIAHGRPIRARKESQHG